MNERAYSRITQNVLKIYGTARAALIIWLSLAFVFALGKMLYEDTSGLSEFDGYWPVTLDKATSKIYLLTITVFQIVSKSLPTFFMLVYHGVNKEFKDPGFVFGKASSYFLVCSSLQRRICPSQ